MKSCRVSGLHNYLKGLNDYWDLTSLPNRFISEDDKIPRVPDWVPGPKPSRVYVYAVEDLGGKYVKIGYAKNVRARFSGIATGCPLELAVRACLAVPVGREKEYENVVHAACSRYHIRGEWFTLSKHTRSVVASMRAYGHEKFLRWITAFIESEQDKNKNMALGGRVHDLSLISR